MAWFKIKQFNTAAAESVALVVRLALAVVVIPEFSQEQHRLLFLVAVAEHNLVQMQTELQAAAVEQIKMADQLELQEQ